MVLESFSIRHGSGGAGKHRGGHGIIRRVRFEEAMTAAVVALLTIYDMCKAVDRGMVISDVCLQEKAGGKSGHWQRSI